MKLLFSIIFISLFLITELSFSKLSENDKAYIQSIGKKAKVIQIINPVTYLVRGENGDVITRLIGLDENAYNIPDYNLLEIQAFLEFTILNKDVYILYENTNPDGVGPLKAYIYYPINPELLLNAVLLYRGYAKINSNEKHRFADEFYNLEKYSRSKGFGFWFERKKDLKNNFSAINTNKTKQFKNIKVLNEIYEANGDKKKIENILKLNNIKKSDIPELFDLWYSEIKKSDSDLNEIKK